MTITRGYVSIADGQVHYLESGEGPALVLLHQTSDSATMWEAVLSTLAAGGYRAVAIDAPGHGNSFVPDFEPEGAQYADWTQQTLTALGVDSCHLLGHHFGATVAMWTAADYPERVRSLLIYGIPMVDPKWREDMRSAVPREFDQQGEVVRHHWVRRWNMSGMLLPEGEQSRFTEAMALRTMIALLQAGKNWCYAYHTMAKTDHAEVAARVRCPVLLFAGPRDHMYRESEAAVGFFPDARFEHMDWVGVDAADEEPKRFSDVVLRFIGGEP